MQKTISAHEASVATVSVSVRTLVIGNRQMTKNLFGQIIRESVFDKSGALRGDIWGWVNIHDKSCGFLHNISIYRVKEHMHVVWQKEDELRVSDVLCVAEYDGAPSEYRTYKLAICSVGDYTTVKSRGQLYIAS